MLQNREAPRVYQIKAQADEAHIYLYDVIGEMFGIGSGKFVADLNQLDGKSLTLHINSPGGDTFDGIKMANAVRAYPGRVTCVIEGLAASAATLVALGADKVLMNESSMFMIHNSWTLCIGNADDFKKQASLLAKIDQQVLQSYVSKTGKDPDMIRNWMAQETWFTQKEALDTGFCDGFVKSSSENIAWDLSSYEHAPQAHLKQSDPDQEMRLHRAQSERKLKMFLQFS